MVFALWVIHLKIPKIIFLTIFFNESKRGWAFLGNHPVYSRSTGTAVSRGTEYFTLKL